MNQHIDPREVQVGDRLRFDGKATSWLVRARSEYGRYLLATGSIFGDVYYSILDLDENIRGPLNVIGHGVGIETLSGPDPYIDEAMAMLEGRSHPDGCECGEFRCKIHPEQYRVSRRACVPLVISTRTPAGSSKKD